MIDDPTPSLVLGEAPESDEEEVFERTKTFNIVDSTGRMISSVPAGMAIIGEAIESDEEIEVHNIENRNALNAYELASGGKLTNDAKSNLSNTKKQKSAAVKKLCEKNKSLHDNLISFKKQILHSTNFELNNINQQLLRSQIELQQTLTNIRSVKVNLNELHKKLNDIIVANYIPKININVPSHII